MTGDPVRQGEIAALGSMIKKLIDHWAELQATEHDAGRQCGLDDCKCARIRRCWNPEIHDEHLVMAVGRAAYMCRGGERAPITEEIQHAADAMIEASRYFPLERLTVADESGTVGLS